MLNSVALRLLIVLCSQVTPTQFLETINAINECLIHAHSLRYSLFDNALSFFTLQISRAFLKSHYEKEMERLHQLIDKINIERYNPVGLNILWPRKVAFMFVRLLRHRVLRVFSKVLHSVPRLAGDRVLRK